MRRPLLEDAPGHVRQRPTLLPGGRLNFDSQRRRHAQHNLLGELFVFHKNENKRGAIFNNAPPDRLQKKAPTLPVIVEVRLHR
jgi:hypothetical protein